MLERVVSKGKPCFRFDPSLRCFRYESQQKNSDVKSLDKNGIRHVLHGLAQCKNNVLLEGGEISEFH